MTDTVLCQQAKPASREGGAKGRLSDGAPRNPEALEAASRLQPRWYSATDWTRRSERAPELELDAHHDPAEGRPTDLVNRAAAKMLRLPTWSAPY
jgi:hypothetical protein